MTAALDGGQRTALSNLIQKARSLLEADLASTLEGDYGIHRSGRTEEVDALALDASQEAVRLDLLDIIAFLRSEGETEPAAVERLIREAAFTHVNRLVALRVAEGLGILPEAIGNGLASQGFRDFAEIAPASADEDWERFRLLVRICADELSADVPALFDPRNPLLELEPSTAAFSELIELVIAADVAIWSAPDALGWSYQFFNSAKERTEMRESSAPRTSRELAVRNQFFTPSYVVEFLVQNGLGAHLAASYPALADELPLLVEVPGPVSEPVDLREVSVLDPACGSGHFLLGAYDVLEAAWRHAGVEPDEAAPSILGSLWGIDIDPRATQIAQAAVIFRARRHCRAALPKPNVICARSLPTGPEAEALIARLPAYVGRVVRAIADELVMAPVLGPLLKIEERLGREARDAFGIGQVKGTLSEGVSDADAADIESLVLKALSSIADQTASTASQRLFAAEAHDAVRYVEAMTQRYTALVLNPPFGEPIETTKRYLKANYPWLPAKDSNLFALFVGRSKAMCARGGNVAAITPRNGFFQSTYAAWREQVLLSDRLSTVLDLGSDVMDDALVEAAAYVIEVQKSPADVAFVRLLASSDKGSDLREEARTGYRSQICPRVEQSDFGRLPASPLLYWDPAEIRQSMLALSSVGSVLAAPRQGLITGDDFRFLRMWWELGIHADGWVPMPKGGAYSPYWREIEYLVDWSNDGERIRGTGKKARVQGVQWFGQGGLTWVGRTNSGFAPAYLPDGCIFSSRGPSLPIADQGMRLATLGWLMSRFVRWYFESTASAGEESKTGGTAARDYTVGLVDRAPFPANTPPRAIAEVGELVDEIIRLVAQLDSGREPSRAFVQPLFLESASTDLEEMLAHERESEVRVAMEVLDRHARIDAIFRDSLGLTPNEHELGAMCGPLVGALGPAESEDSEPDIELDALELARARWGNRRWSSLNYHVVDRDLETRLAAAGCRPDEQWFARYARQTRRDVDSGRDRLVSFAVGVAFSRWTTTRGTSGTREEWLSPYEVSVAPPPERVLRSRVLVDQPGHPDDLPNLVLRTIGERRGDVFAGDFDERFKVRAYLRTHFFKHHLETYRSRSSRPRYAPIYWPLQVGSRRWGVWLYAPTMSRDILFGIRKAADDRLSVSAGVVGQLQDELHALTSGRSASVLSKELDVEQKLAVELVAFRDEAERIANLGWDPDLDDGAVLNAAPLASLFPAWKDAAKYRKELEQGKHSWSTVSKYADQL